MYNYLIIEKICGFAGPGYRVHADLDGARVQTWTYYGYSKRDAERLYRERFDLKRKHFIKVNY